jgi:hypothetical protein
MPPKGGPVLGKQNSEALHRTLRVLSLDSSLLPAEVLKIDRTDVVGYTYDWFWLNGDNLGQAEPHTVS